MDGSVKKKITRLRIFVTNLQRMELNSTTLIQKRLGRMHPLPKVSRIAFTVNVKNSKPLPALARRMQYILSHSGPIEEFSLRNPALEEEIDFAPFDKSRIFKSLTQHNNFLQVLSLEFISFEDFSYLADAFCSKRLLSLHSLYLLNLFPDKVSEETTAKIVKGLRMAECVENLTVTIAHTKLDETVAIINALSELSKLKTVKFTFPIFSKLICAAYTKFFEKPTLVKIVTKAYEYTETCMNPFSEIVFLRSTLKCIKFCSKNADPDTEYFLVDMKQFFRLIPCSSLEEFSLKNVCVEGLHKHTGIIFHKNSMLKRLTLKKVCPLKDLSAFLLSIPELSKLEELSLNFPLCDPKTVTALGQCLTSASKLVFINLEDCKIPDSLFAATKPDRLFKGVRCLKLKGNYLRHNAFNQIIELIKNPYTVIEYLDVTDMEVAPKEICEMFKVMQSHSSLKVFIWNCLYGSVVYESLNLVVKYSGNIKKLSIKDTNFSPVNIFRALKKPSKLRYLSIGVSIFDHMSVRKLWKIFAKNYVFNTLSLNLLWTNFKTGCTFEYIFKELIKRMEPNEIMIKLQRYSKEDNEYSMKFFIKRKLKLRLNLNILRLEEFVKEWWDFKKLHSVIIGERFVKDKLGWIKWIIEHKLKGNDKEKLLFYFRS